MHIERHAVVLVSGGLDSATTLAIAREMGFTCHAITFDYGQRHRVELQAAAAVAQSMDVAAHHLIRIDLRAFGGSALTADIAVPKDRLDPAAAQRGVPSSTAASAAQSGSETSRDQGSEGSSSLAASMTHASMHHASRTEVVPITYVPARNTIFLSFALAYAETHDAADIFIGVNAVDYSGYPDCRPEFIEAFERMANLGTRMGIEGRRIRVHTPLIQLTKAEIIQRGIELNVDYSLTISCYDPNSQNGRPCGHCDSCLLRAAGFAQAGVRDPALT